MKNNIYSNICLSKWKNDITRNYYDVLGVAQDAEPDEIKRAYRRLARQYHPDRNPGDKAAAKNFGEVAEAYAVLSDDRDNKGRKLYDRGCIISASGNEYRVNGRSNSSDDFARAAAAKSAKEKAGTDKRKKEEEILDELKKAVAKVKHDLAQEETAWSEVRGMRGKTLSDKIDDAVKRGAAASVLIILPYCNNVIPLEKTLKYAVQNKLADCVEAFIDAGTKPTPEMMAIAMHNRDEATMRFLIRSDVKPDQKMLQKMLEEAVRQRLTYFVERFVVLGAKPTQKMVDIAKRNNDTEIVSFLKIFLLATETKTEKRRRFGFPRRKQPTP